MNIDIRDLRDEARYRDLVRDRIWHAWWEPDGSLISDLEEGLAEVAAAKDYPSFTLIAMEVDRFLGTVTGIKNDVEARSDLEPFIAALWVEEDARGRSVGRRLIEAACARFAQSGFSRVHLGAKPHLRGFYSDLGWVLLESDVGEDGLDVFFLSLPDPATAELRA